MKGVEGGKVREERTDLLPTIEHAPTDDGFHVSLSENRIEWSDDRIRVKVGGIRRIVHRSYEAAARIRKKGCRIGEKGECCETEDIG